MKSALFLSILMLVATCRADTNGTIRCAADLFRAVFERQAVGSEFDLTARATTGSSGLATRMAVEDESGGMMLVRETPEAQQVRFAAGDRLRLRGMVGRGQRSRIPYANCRQIDVLGPGSALEPPLVSIRSVLRGEHDCRLVHITGKVRDVFQDEIDPGFLFLILRTEDDVIYLPFFVGRTTVDALDRLIGAEVAVCGICTPQDIAARRTIGRIFYPTDGLSSVRVLREAGDPFGAPALAGIPQGSPSEIVRLGRHRATGRVIAVWDRNKLLLRTAGGNVLGIALANENAPACGATVDVVGFPESDLYRINLSRAIWRPSAQAIPDDEKPLAISVREFMTDARGRTCYNPYAHGRALRLVGTVVNLPGVGNDDGRLTLQCDEYLVPVDFSAQPDALRGLDVGCRVEVTGTCVMESENWRPDTAFPRIRGFALVVREPADVRILARPPWWTPGRLAIVIGSLLAALAAILVWNAALRHVAERRGRQLFRSQIAQTTSALKVEERTRLAVELHDAISQNLTGASMQIDAARKLLRTNPDKTARHLDLASITLESSREELRNCIWDLRNQSLEAPDMNVAIRRTLERHLGEAKLSVRFNVPRSRFSDNTAHALLRIIRELVTNAVRHGRATEIKVAGARENGRLRFSVRDNGCGFDPATAAGRNQGHFGLQGVRERLRQMDGSLELDSKPGLGTKATVSLFLTQHAGNHEP